jgi:hypothetical protein
MRHLVTLALLFSVHTAIAAPSADVQARIFNYFLDRAENGDASAQFIVGFRYESGSGTERDMKKAMDWYTKAAAQGHEQARERIGAPASQPAAAEPVVAPVPVAQPAVKPAPKPVAKTAAKKTPEPAKPKAKTVAKPAATVAATSPATKRKEIVQPAATVAAASPVPHPSPVLVPVVTSEKPVSSVIAATQPAPIAINVAGTPASAVAATPPAAEKKAEPPPINTLEVVLGGKWARNEVAPDYLPSSNTSCLRTGGEKIVCFSGGAQAHVDGNAVMYAVKSTLSDFSPNGTFRVQYVFNVTDVTADASTSGPDARDLVGLASRLGWQEPGLVLDCSVNEAGRISCMRNGRQQLTFYRQ